METTNTTFAKVIRDGDTTTVQGDMAQMSGWARNPYASWPCSNLRDYDLVTATFVDGDLVELAVIQNGEDVEAIELGADELNAWTSDALVRAGYPNHPAIR